MCARLPAQVRRAGAPPLARCARFEVEDVAPPKYAVVADILVVMMYGWYRMVKDGEIKLVGRPFAQPYTNPPTHDGLHTSTHI